MLRRFRITLALALFLIGFAALPASGHAPPASTAELTELTGGHPALEAIASAFEGGEITESEAVLYRLYFLKDFHKLPARFQIPGEPIKCGTDILLDIHARAGQMPAAVREEIEDYRARPYLPLSRETSHFMIHYQIGGSNGVPDEAWVDVVEEACETAWTTYHSTMNWDIPPGDGSLGGGTNKTDCYIHALDPGILGLAEPENLVPGGEPYDHTGYFHVNNSISNTNQRRVTVVHEYMHVVQFGYYGYQTAAWYMENCAMMGEEWCYDAINDYRGYLSGFFAVPYKSLKTHNGIYEYAQIVWPMYQSERFDNSAPEAIWDSFQWSGNIFDATDEGLGPYGFDLHTAYSEFMMWCMYTNVRDDGNHFEEGGQWNNLFYPNLTLNSYPTGEKHPTTNQRPEALGTSIMKFVRESGDPNNRLVVDFDGPDCTQSVDFMAKYDGQHVFVEYSMLLDDFGNGSIEIPDFDVFEYVFMLVSMSRPCNTAQDYAFWADTEQGVSNAGEGPGAVVARIHPGAPNPFANNTRIAYDLPGRAQVGVRIYDASGRAVRELFSGAQSAGRYEVIWDGSDDGGAALGSGVYFAHVAVDGRVAVQKVTLLK